MVTRTRIDVPNPFKPFIKKIVNPYGFAIRLKNLAVQISLKVDAFMSNKLGKPGDKHVF